MTTLQVDAERLWRSLMTMAKIGATPKGGVNRQTLTREDRRGRGLFRTWCEEAGLQVSVDRMGSMFARRGGTENDWSTATWTASGPRQVRRRAPRARRLRGGAHPE
jgi:acetylornithine deacetylase/succinyl-diaminopimelate desuccinylase-like protein